MSIYPTVVEDYRCAVASEEGDQILLRPAQDALHTFAKVGLPDFCVIKFLNPNAQVGSLAPTVSITEVTDITRLPVIARDTILVREMQLYIGALEGIGLATPNDARTAAEKMGITETLVNDLGMPVVNVNQRRVQIDPEYDRVDVFSEIDLSVLKTYTQDGRVALERIGPEAAEELTYEHGLPMVDRQYMYVQEFRSLFDVTQN